MKALALLIFLSACASVQKQELSTLNELSAPECTVDQKDLRRPVFAETTSGIGSLMGHTGSAALATVGFATDVVVVLGPAILVAAACAENSGGCNGNSGDLAVLGMQTYAETDFTGFGVMALESTQGWRCPYVDHITKAFRKAARCNAKRGHYAAAFAQLDFLDRDETLKKCVSAVERLEIDSQRSLLQASAVPSQNEEKDSLENLDL